MKKLPQHDNIQQWALTDDDWSELLGYAAITPELFAAVSLNLHPNGSWQDAEFIRGNYGRYVETPKYPKILEAYSRRLSVLKNNALADRFGEFDSISGSGASEYSISKYVQFAKELEWEIPSQLQEALSREQDGNNKFDQAAAFNPHKSDWLQYYNQASARFWANVDPMDKSTHPNNNVVVEWLVSKGVTRRNAESGATAIRPDFASTGRKPG